MANLISLEYNFPFLIFIYFIGQFSLATCQVKEASIEQFPFMVSIRRNILEIENFTAVHVCSGVLLTSTVIATTASCLCDINGNLLSRPFSFIIVAGSANLNDFDGIERPSANSSVHSNFTLGDINFDVGIIKVRQAFPVNENTIVVAKVLESGGYLSEDCETAGWGATAMRQFASLQGNLHSSRLRVNNDCTVFMAYEYNITVGDSLICAETTEENIPFCYMDSGSPLVCGGVVAGLASVYTDCYDSKKKGTGFINISMLHTVIHYQGKTEFAMPRASKNQAGRNSFEKIIGIILILGQSC